MNAEFFAAIEDIEKEKGIPRSYMYEKIRVAMLNSGKAVITTAVGLIDHRTAVQVHFEFRVPFEEYVLTAFVVSCADLQSQVLGSSLQFLPHRGIECGGTQLSRQPRRSS